MAKKDDPLAAMQRIKKRLGELSEDDHADVLSRMRDGGPKDALNAMALIERDFFALGHDDRAYLLGTLVVDEDDEVVDATYPA